jgi:biotin-dependent carboxylase-like uncharacterized protein
VTDGLRVLSPGLHTTVQDLGRIGWQALGVPVSGALDGFSLRLGNAIVGNPGGTAALEALYRGPTLEVAAANVRAAAAGIGARLVVAGAAERIVPGWRSVTLGRGDVFRLECGGQSACCYLVVLGGIAVPPFLGSASTYVRARLGGLAGRPLQAGDVVPLAGGQTVAGEERWLPAPPVVDTAQPIRVVLGPQREFFTDDAVATLLGAEFRVSQQADRMGLRLEGPPLRHRAGWDIVSDAIPTGAIQVPGSGQPILLLADHQTTGGYPKIATVASADLPAIGRRRPGDAVRFAAIDIEAAERLCRQAESELMALIATSEPLPPEAALDLGLLYAANLISGVVSGRE